MSQSVSLLHVHSPETAIVHDYLTQRGGAERVVLALRRGFPKSTLITSLYQSDTTYPEFKQQDLTTSWLQSIPAFRKNHRLALPLLAPTFSSISIDAPAVICSTSGWAHGIRTPGKKILYVYNVARWLYQPDDYFRSLSPALRRSVPVLLSPLRRWDKEKSQTADRVITISKAVQDRIWKYWSLESEILHPPHGATPDGPSRPIPDLEPGFFLSVGRLLAYKRVDVLTQAMARLPHHQLVVIGSGPLFTTLQRTSPSNVRYLGAVDEDQLRWAYRNCLAVVSASSEDFGLTPLEAMAYGRPSVVIREGGFLETIEEGRNGIFFDSQHPEALAKALDNASRTSWDSAELIDLSQKYSGDYFRSRLNQIITDAG